MYRKSIFNNPDYFVSNRIKFMEKLEDDTVAVLFSGTDVRKTADQYYPFFCNRNFYYITGIEQEGSALIIKKKAGKILKLVLVLKPCDKNSERWTGRRLRSFEASSFSGIYDIMYSESPDVALKKELEGWKGSVSVDKDGLSVCCGWFYGFMQDYFPQIEIKDIYSLFSKMRMIKSDYEVNMIKRALEYTKKGLEIIYEKAGEGVFEYELAAEFSAFLARNGLGEPAFDTIVAAGENFNYLHYPFLDSKLKKDDMVLLDLGVSYASLNCDISRAFPVNGKFADRQLAVYEAVRKCQIIAFCDLKPGAYIKDVNAKCMETAAEELIDMGVIYNREDINKYYWHNVSHHLGLDVHDICGREHILEKGMVLTVEPGIYIKEWGVGLRIEDNVLITEDGCEILSEDIPREAHEMELLTGGG